MFTFSKDLTADCMGRSVADAFYKCAEGDADSVGEEVRGVERGAENQAANPGRADRINPRSMVNLGKFDGPRKAEGNQSDLQCGSSVP